MGIHKNKMKKMKSGGSANKSTFYAIGGMLDRKISSANNMMNSMIEQDPASMGFEVLLFLHLY